MPRTPERIAAMRAQGMSEAAIYRALGYPACSDFILTMGPDPIPGEEVFEPGMHRIVEAVALELGVRSAEIMAPSRRGDDQAVPRQLSMLLIRETLDQATLARIGEFFGRDHTTVQHAIRRAETVITEQPGMARAIAVVRRGLASPPVRPETG